MPRRIEITESNPKERSRWTEISGTVIAPGEPPTHTDAQVKLWGEYFADETGEVDMPEPEDVAAELSRMQELYDQGMWERP